MRLSTTTPGLNQGLKTTTGFPPGKDFIGAGTREVQNSISLDGISIANNLITNTPTGPWVEAIQELEVQTGTYPAQIWRVYGRPLEHGGRRLPYRNPRRFQRRGAFLSFPPLRYITPLLISLMIGRMTCAFGADDVSRLRRNPKSDDL